ncbi:30S ribosomal protein S2 [Patescibacteria group bacterium]|nr:30S ribosomal protein S2 [Patescibacteria group bacterium]
MEKKQAKFNKVKMPSTDELAKAGVHLGHHKTKRSPKMEPYIYGVKNNINIIDLDKTVEKLQLAVNFLTELASQGGVVLFVGTKPAAKDIIQKSAQEIGAPFVVEHWLGGTLTNFSTISELMKKLNKMTEEKKQGGWEKYSKKEQLEIKKKLNRLEKMVGGMREINKKPDAIYVIDLQKEKTAIREARRSKVPVIALVDTNSNPELVDWPIPGNDDAVKSIELITSLVAEAIEQGRKKIKN